MKSLFKVSILGLGHSEVVTIRQHIAAILQGSEVDWVGANHDSLDFLIVNSNFINASSVQNLLRSNSVPVLLARHSLDQEYEDRYIITLPLVENTVLKNWINQIVLSGNAVQLPQSIKIQKSVVTQVLLENAKVFETLLTAKDNFLYLSDRCGAVGTIDTTNQLIYLVPKRSFPVDMQGTLSYEAVSHVSLEYQSVDLLQWLWDVVWFESSCSVFIQADQLVKIKFWPQPSRTTDRKDLLLLSAKLARKPSTAQELANDLKLPLWRTQHFLSALVMAGFAEKCTDIQTKILISPDQPENKEEATGLRRLLLGMRRRLGL